MFTKIISDPIEIIKAVRKADKEERDKIKKVYSGYSSFCVDYIRYQDAYSRKNGRPKSGELEIDNKKMQLLSELFKKVNKL